MARTLDIYCKVCNSKAIVTRTERIHSDFSKSYCSCKNKACGHKFVINVEFSHTTKTSLLTKDALIETLLANSSPQDRQRYKRILEEQEKKGD
ncbi:ogr/Delta-like zinc finger family protein [Pasteurella multocida]|uniref:ogr/Delta-like zinc finger family protein n=1 Tax=Pasteurella multocida TaxID=747 RepID=UPI002C4EF696|nr:ogr/Delta-like zinc finger family protein [Pasteurella multocida]MEB3457147.1 ogr/Delta-like zinc finger family protein [Pasteurella multocida]